MNCRKNHFGKRRCATPCKRNPARKTSPTNKTTANQSAIKKQDASTEVRPSAQTKEAQLTHWLDVGADTRPSYLYDAACGCSLAHSLLVQPLGSAEVRHSHSYQTQRLATACENPEDKKNKSFICHAAQINRFHFVFLYFFQMLRQNKKKKTPTFVLPKLMCKQRQTRENNVHKIPPMVTSLIFFIWEKQTRRLKCQRSRKPNEASWAGWGGVVGRTSRR